MAKRFFILFLVLGLTFSLAVGAAATGQPAPEESLDCPEDADLTPPLWEQWGYASLADCLEQTGMDEYEYWDEVWWEESRLDWIDSFEAEYPQWRDNYKKHAPYAQWGFDSIQVVMDEQGFATEDEAWDWLCDAYIDNESYDPYQSLIYRVAMGGPAYGIGVQWMGTYIVFPDARPELTDGRTMVPVRAFMECVGAQADYADGTVVLTLPGGTAIRFAPGETTAYVETDAGEISFEMDVAPYIKEGRTYVPVRFFGQALGYDVLWDSSQKTAVILDRAVVTAELNESFSVLNRVYAAIAAQSADSSKTTGRVNAQLTLFDSLDGDQTGTAAAAITGYSGPQGANLTMDVDARTFVALLLAKLEPTLPADDADAQLIREQLAGLGQLQLRLIQDTEKGILFVQLPQAFGPLLGLELPENCWLSLELPELPDAASASGSIGDMLYESFANDWCGVDALETMRASAADMAALLGDDCFARTGGGWKLTLGDAAAAMLEELFYYETPELQKAELTVSDNGGISGSVSLRVNPDMDLWGFGGTAVQYTADFSLNARGASLQWETHTKNVSKWSVSVRSDRSAYTGSFPLSPDADALVLTEYELGELLYGGYAFAAEEATAPDLGA